jgi:hypothetical protein
MRQDISCTYCGEWAGSYYPAKVSGLPENCYPAEYDHEPAATNDVGNEFCSDKCMKAFTTEQMTAEEYAEREHPEGCLCPNNGGGDCDYCAAIWDWEHNDIDWRIEAL